MINKKIIIEINIIMIFKNLNKVQKLFKKASLITY